jgi:hypothetical protein
MNPATIELTAPDISCGKWPPVDDFRARFPWVMAAALVREAWPCRTASTCSMEQSNMRLSLVEGQ